jgi:hypothetical protein
VYSLSHCFNTNKRPTHANVSGKRNRVAKATRKMWCIVYRSRTVVRVASSVFVAHGIALLVGEPAHLQHGDDAGRRSISALIIIIIIIIT